MSIGLYYYGARYYDPSIGRFITEDTYQGELVDPQSQNVYLYTLNIPMRYVDPTGHFGEEIGEYWNEFADWFTGYDESVTIDWQTELDTNIEKSLSKWNFS